jgi:BASS family bile acid:Na+ symporter
MIIAAAPGGVTSNVLTKFANGDVALSISLTAIVSLISIATVPFIIFHSAEFLEIEILKEIAMNSIATKMFFVVTVPVLLGMIIRKLKQDLVMAYESFFQKFQLFHF